MLRSLILALFALSASVFACEDKTPAGFPETPVPTTLLCKTDMVIEYYDACKAPLLVIEHLVPTGIGGVEPRVTFKPDPVLDPSVRANKSDYAKSGYDMGHLAPAADFKDSSIEMRESFYLSNAVPQAPSLNRGPWRSLEMRARALAVKKGEIFVITGAIYSEPKITIGSGVCVPDAVYKVIVDLKAREGIAYLIPNKNNSLAYGNYVMSIAEVERQTGVVFLPLLDRTTAKKIKSSVGSTMSGVR